MKTRLQGYKATRLQGYKATRLQGYNHILWLLLCVMILTIGCSKDNSFPSNNVKSKQKTMLRSGVTIDSTFLTNIQDYLIDLRDNGISTASFTTEEVEVGIETLVNLQYSRYLADASTTFDVDTFNYDPSSENDYYLFEKVRNSIVADTLNHHIVAYDLELDTTINGVQTYLSTTIFSGGDIRTGNSPQSCGYFSQGESYYFGIGEYFPDSPSIDLKCYRNGYDSCGGTDENGYMITTAITEIQKKFNQFSPEVYCPDYDNAHGDFIKYLDIKSIKVSLSWNEINSFPYNYYQCEIDPLPLAGGLISCDCVNSLQLNSLYNVVGEDLSRQMSTQYPGYKFISMNFATDKGVPVNVRKAIRPVLYRVYIGKPFCVYYLDLNFQVDIFNDTP